MPRKKVKRRKKPARKKTSTGKGTRGTFVHGTWWRSSQAASQDARAGLRHLRKSDLPLLDAVQYAVAQLHAKQDPDESDEYLRAIEAAARPRLIAMIGSRNDDTSLAAIRVATRLREALGKRQVATVEYANKAMDALTTMRVAELQAEVIKAGEAAGGWTPDAWSVAMAKFGPMLAARLEACHKELPLCSGSPS